MEVWTCIIRPPPQPQPNPPSPIPLSASDPSLSPRTRPSPSSSPPKPYTAPPPSSTPPLAASFSFFDLWSTVDSITSSLYADMGDQSPQYPPVCFFIAIAVRFEVTVNGEDAAAEEVTED